MFANELTTVPATVPAIIVSSNEQGIARQAFSCAAAFACHHLLRGDVTTTTTILEHRRRIEYKGGSTIIEAVHRANRLETNCKFSAYC